MPRIGKPQRDAMDDAKNFVLGIFQTGRERFGNPLVSAFAIAWAIWNFRLLLVLVGDGGWRDKIVYIDTKLMTEWWHWLLHGTTIPLAAALFWIYVLPPALRKIATDHEKMSNLNREALFQVAETRTLSVQEALEMRAIMIKQRAEWQQEKAETAQSLENLQKAGEKREATIAALKNELEEAQAEITKLKAPPPREKFDYHKQDTGVKAHHFGIRLTQPSHASTPLVLYDDQPVLWPWTPSDHQQFEFPVKGLFLSHAGEETIFSMLALAQHGSRHGKAIDSWTSVLRSLGVARPDEQVQTLVVHGFLRNIPTNGSVYELHEPGMQFARWLRQIGFSAPSLLAK